MLERTNKKLERVEQEFALRVKVVEDERDRLRAEQLHNEQQFKSCQTQCRGRPRVNPLASTPS